LILRIIVVIQAEIGRLPRKEIELILTIPNSISREVSDKHWTRSLKNHRDPWEESEISSMLELAFIAEQLLISRGRDIHDFTVSLRYASSIFVIFR
jgi:hypothetical protein